eukprot:gene26761-32338_t
MLIVAVFLDNKRAISFEDGCEIWSLPEDGQVFWDGSSHRLIIQPQWLQLYKQLIDGVEHTVMLEGKAGRGKSVFLRYLIIRMLEDPAIPIDATFAYEVKDNTIGNTHIFWIAKRGVSVAVVMRITEVPTYLLLDSVDSALHLRGRKLNLGLTSGDSEVLKKFRKRVLEAGSKGKFLAMQALDLTAMRLIFPTLSNLEFRFDVLGGNPRRFQDFEPATVSQEIKNLVFPELQKCITMFFGASYDHTSNTPNGKLAKWALYLIAREVQRSADCDSSLFRAEFATDDGCCEERFASTFLRLVAGALDSKNDATLREALKKIVGSSGLGYAHEYLSHAAFLAGNQATITFGVNPNRNIVQLPDGLYGRAVTLVRNIPDLQNLRGLITYGLPTITNFPAVDAIVSTNLLQMTISDKHGGAVGKLPDIATALGVAVENLLLIFVVESIEKALTFKFPELPGIQMVVTPRDCVSAAVWVGVAQLPDESCPHSDPRILPRMSTKKSALLTELRASEKPRYCPLERKILRAPFGITWPRSGRAVLIGGIYRPVLVLQGVKEIEEIVRNTPEGQECGVVPPK